MENQIITRVSWLDLIQHHLEQFTLTRTGSGYLLEGTVDPNPKEHLFQVKYQVACDSRWRTRLVHIEVTGGKTPHLIDLTTNGQGGWYQNGVEVHNVCGCLDVDLEITPSTNMLPIRRLGLRVGGSAEIQATWIRFPDLSIEPLRQVYTRTGENLYHYESGNNGFEAEIEVDNLGLPVRYGNIWLRKEIIEEQPEEPNAETDRQ